MSEHDDIAAALGQVVELGSSAQQAELGAAVSRQIQENRSGTIAGRSDPEVVAALRNLAREPAGDPVTATVHVDFNALLATVGEPQIWTILGKLKDLFS